MTRESVDESILKRLVLGDLDPHCPEALEALRSSAGLRQRWQSAIGLGAELDTAASEASSILEDAREAPIATTAEDISRLVRATTPLAKQPQRRFLFAAAAAACVAMILLGFGLGRWRTVAPHEAPSLSEVPIILNDHVSGIEVQVPVLAEGRLPVLEWSDSSASLFTDYVVVIHAGSPAEPGPEVLRSPRLPQRRWAMSAEQSAMLPKWGTIKVIAYGAQKSVSVDISAPMDVSFEKLFSGQ